jgi:quercetin 2,3-dioxygenase
VANFKALAARKAPCCHLPAQVLDDPHRFLHAFRRAARLRLPVAPPGCASRPLPSVSSSSMTVFPPESRLFADHGALQAYCLFSFAHLTDPENVQFGPLRVFNDEVLSPRAALPLHPHAEMELVTIGLAGALTYADAQGYQRTVAAGDVQRLTAGTGMQHAESNRGLTAAHTLQLWLLPGQRGLQASQEQRSIPFLTSRDEWVPLGSGRGDGAGQALFLNCDASIWWATLSPGRSLPYVPDEDRRQLLYVVSGAVTLNGRQLTTHAHARLENEQHLTIASPDGGSVVLVDLP